MKKTFKFLLVTVLILLVTPAVILAGVWANNKLSYRFDLDRADRDRAFERKLLWSLAENGGALLLKDLEEGEWSYICIVGEYYGLDVVLESSELLRHLDWGYIKKNGNFDNKAEYLYSIYYINNEQAISYFLRRDEWLIKSNSWCYLTHDATLIVHRFRNGRRGFLVSGTPVG